MISGRIQIRRYENQIATLITNLDNLAEREKSSELRRWRDWDLHVLLHDPLVEQYRTAYATVRDDASERGLHIYPAFRTQPLSWKAQDEFHFASYMTPEFWQTNAARLTSVAALRLPCDPWIGIDMENYADVPHSVEPQDEALAAQRRPGREGPQPTATALNDTDNPGLNRHFTVGQLRAGMQPFIDAIRATNASVAIYPAGLDAGEDVLYLAETFSGEQRVELWTESTFNLSEDYRRSSARKWPADAVAFLELMGQLQARFPGCIVRPGINDIERVWADPYRRDLLRTGPYAPWGFDYTRHDAADFGKPGYRTGITLSDHNLNSVRHVWPMQPMGTSVPTEFDTTVRQTPKSLSQYAENATHFKIWGGTATRHPDGIQLLAPKPSDLWAWAGLGGENVLPDNSSAPFTVDGSLRLPVDLPNSCPLFGGVWDKVALWQVAYFAPPQDVIALCVRRAAPAPPGELKYHFREMMKAPPRGVDLRLQVGREGTRWLFQAAAPELPVTGGLEDLLPADHGYCTGLLIGAGQAVADFPIPGALHTNSFAHCPGIVLVKTWSIYDRLLSNDELAELRTETWPEKPREGSWPYGYGRG